MDNKIGFKNNNFTLSEVYLALRDKNLLTLTIMLENVCNFKCPFCYTQSKREKYTMTTEQIVELIDGATNCGVKSILIAGAGEPILAYNFFEICDYIASKGLGIVIFSNLSLMNKDIAKRLKEYDASVIGKINSFQDNVQERLIGAIDGAAAAMKKGLQILIDTGFNHVDEHNESSLAIETPILPENIDEIYDLWVFCRNNNIIPIVDTVLYSGRAEDSDYDSFLVNYDRLLQEIRRIQLFDQKIGYKWDTRIVRRENNKGIIVGEIGRECIRIGTNINIDQEGNVYDCFNMSTEPYGNITVDGFSEIWMKVKETNAGIKVHGLCSCRNITCRDSLEEELLKAMVK